MTCQEFTVLYTHQKTKKSKVWQDGVLKTSIGGNKVTLFDDKGQCLESIFVRTQVKPGDDLEGDQYLITVEAEKATENNCTYPPKKIEASASNRNGVKPSNLPLLHLPVGLKRKFTGFKGPRQVEKRVATVEESVSPATSSSKWCQSPFSSKLYVTSPLFSAICKKQSGSSLPENSNSVVCASSAREDVFISSLVSSPYTNSYKEDIQNRNHCHPIAGSVLTKQEPSVTGCLKAACETVGVEVSQNIRSKAQIIALLKSKPTQQCREQKAEDIKDISRCQPSERRGILCKQNSTFVPEGANNTDIGSTKDTEHQYHAEITETNTSRWDVYMLPSSGGQSYDGVVMGKKYDQETNDASLTLQAPCHPKALQFFTTSVQPVGQELKYSCMELMDDGEHDNGECKLTSEASTVCRSDGAAKLLAINGCIGKDQPSSTVLSESNINKKNNLKCASSSEAVYYARNADEFVTFETNIPKSSENSETDSVKEPEGFLAQPQINSQSRINVDSVAGDSGVPVCVTCAGPKAVHEDLPECGKLSDLPEQFLEVNFNLLETFDFSNTEDKELCEGNVLSQCSAGSTEGAVTQKEMRVHGQCEVMTLSYQEKDVKQLTFLGGTDENFTPECLPLQACVKTSEGCDRIERDAAAPSQIEVRCSDADTVVEDANRSTLNIETAISKNLDFYPACTINDMSLVNNKHTDLVQSGVNNYECDDNSNKFEKNKIVSYIPSALKTSIDKNSKKDTIELGSANSQGSCLEYFSDSPGGDINSESPLVTFPLMTGCSDGSCHDAGKYHAAFTTQIFKRDTLAKIQQSSEEGEMDETEFENVSTIMNSIQEPREDERMRTDCMKYLACDENSSGLPDLPNDISLLRSLTEHSTALESLHSMEKCNSLLYQRETSKYKCEPTGKFEARKQFAEVSCSGDMQTSCLYFDSSNQRPSSVEAPVLETPILPVIRGRGNLGTFDYQPKSPGSMNSPEDDLNFITEENIKKSDFIEEPDASKSSVILDMTSKIPEWMESSPSDFNLELTQWTTRKHNKVMSQLFSSLNPDSISLTLNSEENMIDIPKQESLTCGALPSDTEHLEFFSRIEQSSCPGDGNLSRPCSRLRTRTPLVTVPATGKIPDSEVYSGVTGCEEVQQAFGSPTVKMYDKSAVFHVSAFGPEDRKYETFGSGECMEKRQEAFMQPVFPNVASQNGQSKWLKYQNTAQCDLITQNRGDVKVTDDFCAENVIGMPPADTGESQSDALNKSSSDSVHLQTIKSILGKHRGNFSSQDSVSEGKKLSLHLNHVPVPEATQKVLGQLSCQTVTGDTQDISISELSFPAGRKVKYANFPQRKIFIPTAFQSHAHYKQIFTAALTEHLNILLFELSERLHKALLKVDISFYTSVENGQGESEENHVPLCNHKQAAKLVMVKKEGKNKGRLFYTCDAPKADQCTFFKWVEEVNPGQKNSRPNVVLHDVKSIGAYLRSQRIFLYEECQLLVRKAFDVQRKQFSKLKKFMILHARVDGDSKNKIYLKLSRREHSSMYSKDDLWVVSKTLNFEPLETFIACSAFFGPSTNNEVELLPLKGFCPSNWHSNIIVHALLVCNASTELTCLRNMQEYFNPNSLPVLQCLLKMPFNTEHANNSVNKRKFIPPALNTKCSMVWGLLSPEVTLALAEKMIQQFQLNMDQARALIQIAQMMSSPETSAEKEEQQVNPITIIHGVFGAGKSYLLSVVVLFLVQVFESSEVSKGPRPTPWKLLIAASTNVAVDRVLLGLLNLGFENFIRVGSIRKIAKPILPHSLHAGSGSENEQLKELLALMKEDLTPIEKIHVRKSIEQHKLGTNKAILQQVRVVGATCAACPFPCMNNLKFPLVVLDECSQMTEPTSLLPIARFQCEKLVLVGDPKQLPPTIQGSESAHENGLEQTLFDRLCLMGHDAVVLRTQYRCHPAISAVASDLFYEGNLLDGISEMDRSPLLDWLPILCFYNVNGAEQIERDNSFYNMAEAYFSAKLIQSLIASGIEGSMIGVITLYKSQMNKVNNLLSGIHSDAHEIKAVQVSTVDAFQGAEKEIIVLSCVRTRQVGFIDSEKRMNVALTRAKRHLLIIGNLGCLSKNKLWGRVIHHCEGTENGLQHVSQYERQLNNILQYYLERKKEEEREKQKEKLIDKSVSQKEV
ncbi:PREDICTED: protein ZGRF1 isoform X1 [Crocodylus porosus]|nr:PREDICTED: protein ZGRF1 isoform X1 [Crocodylus porosus]XP_019389631.1 PREDICTED: protein ZGRF1 isoform X1 [Crocodylus porosus]XP_019389632.1 PREDICTED: protein ZGRF1 isoform X1 [Crocodylus porosus]